MNTATSVIITLGNAALCLEMDCEAIFHITDARCPQCSSENFHPLGSWLGQENFTLVARSAR